MRSRGGVPAQRIRHRPGNASSAGSPVGSGRIPLGGEPWGRLHLPRPDVLRVSVDRGHRPRARSEAVLPLPVDRWPRRAPDLHQQLGGGARRCRDPRNGAPHPGRTRTSDRDTAERGARLTPHRDEAQAVGLCRCVLLLVRLAGRARGAGFARGRPETGLSMGLRSVRPRRLAKDPCRPRLLVVPSTSLLAVADRIHPRLAGGAEARRSDTSGKRLRPRPYARRHLGQPLAGQMGTRDSEDDWRSVEDAIVRLHLSLWPLGTLADVFGATAAESLWVAVLERVRASIARFEAPGSAAKVQGFEYFDWIERQSKFIVNSVRVYEGHGFDWWLPWWDEELLRFWASVPLSLRFGTRLRNHYVDTLQRSLGIDAPPRPTRLTEGVLRGLARCCAKQIDPALRHGLKGDGGWLPSREHPMSWYSLVEPEIARWGYSGATSVNAYLSRRYIQP